MKLDIEGIKYLSDALMMNTKITEIKLQIREGIKYFSDMFS